PRQVPFEQQAIDELTRLLAGLIRALAEHGTAATLVEALKPWQHREEGFVHRAREQVTGQLDEELREALDRAKTHTAKKPSRADHVRERLLRNKKVMGG